MKNIVCLMESVATEEIQKIDEKMICLTFTYKADFEQTPLHELPLVLGTSPFSVKACNLSFFTIMKIKNGWSLFAEWIQALTVKDIF